MQSTKKTRAAAVMNLAGTGVCLLPAAVTLILLKCSGIDAGAEEPAEAIGFALAAVVLIAVAAAVQFPACILSMGYNLFSASICSNAKQSAARHGSTSFRPSSKSERPSVFCSSRPFSLRSSAR